MFKLIIPIKFDKSIPPKKIYQLYYSSLPKLKRNIKFFANKYNQPDINERLLKSKTIMFRDVNKETLYRDIILYALNNLYIYRDITGCVEYRLRPVKNVFAKNITFDQLFRIIEFGNEYVKPLRIFNDAMNKSLPDINRVYNLVYDPNTIKP